MPIGGGVSTAVGYGIGHLIASLAGTPVWPTSILVASREGTGRDGNWLAVGSLALGVVGFLVALYPATPHPYRCGGTSRALALLLSVVLPCGVAGVVLGSTAIRQSPLKGRHGLAKAGLNLGIALVVLTVVGVGILSTLEAMWGPD